MEIKTLEEAGYPGNPFIPNATSFGAVCFVWFSRSAAGRVSKKDLAWTVFHLIRPSGKLVKSEGHLVHAMVPTAHYNRSLEELYALAQIEPPTYRLNKGNEWIGPVLYRSPGDKPRIGEKGLNFLLAGQVPAKSEGIPLSYGVSPGFTPSLQVGIPA